jgi:hypothetical protein
MGLVFCSGPIVLVDFEILPILKVTDAWSPHLTGSSAPLIPALITLASDSFNRKHFKITKNNRSAIEHQCCIFNYINSFIYSSLNLIIGAMSFAPDKFLVKNKIDTPKLFLKIGTLRKHSRNLSHT